MQCAVRHAGQLLQESSKVHKVGIDSVAVSPNASLIATGGADRTIQLYPYLAQVMVLTITTIMVFIVIITKIEALFSPGWVRMQQVCAHHTEFCSGMPLPSQTG